jgi:3-keto-disaccharide hydrolase
MHVLRRLIMPMQCSCFSLVSCAVLLFFNHAAVGASSPGLSEEEKTAGWKLLFDGKTTEGWGKFKGGQFPTRGWVIEGEWFHCLGKGGGDIVSSAQFDQFELQWEWKIAPEGNSGVKYFVTENRNSALGHEYQMIDDPKNAEPTTVGKQATASFYDILPPQTKPPVKPAGEINRSRVLVKGNHVEHWLNGIKVLEYECGSEPVMASVAKSKFKTTSGFGTRQKGHILLQDHGSEVWFRNIKIRDLSGA